MNETPSEPITGESKADTAKVESQYHTYVGTRIPWYVRLIWVLFWIFAVYYVITFLFPDLQREIFNPP